MKVQNFLDRIGDVSFFSLAFSLMGFENEKTAFSPLFINGLDEVFHPGGAFFLHLFCDMTINIQGKRGCGVTKVFLDSFDIIAGFYRSNCIRVAEIMEPRFVKTNLLDNFLIVHVYGMLS